MMADDEKMSSGDDEDALKSICKSGMKADFIAARNQKDFSSSEVMAIRPDESNESERRNTDLGPFGRGGVRSHAQRIWKNIFHCRNLPRICNSVT